jgi:hypothetical protein
MVSALWSIIRGKNKTETRRSRFTTLTQLKLFSSYFLKFFTFSAHSASRLGHWLDCYESQSFSFCMKVFKTCLAGCFLKDRNLIINKFVLIFWLSLKLFVLPFKMSCIFCFDLSVAKLYFYVLENLGIY